MISHNGSGRHTLGRPFVVKAVVTFKRYGTIVLRNSTKVVIDEGTKVIFRIEKEFSENIVRIQIPVRNLATVHAMQGLKDIFDDYPCARTTIFVFFGIHGWLGNGVLQRMEIEPHRLKDEALMLPIDAGFPKSVDRAQGAGFCVSGPPTVDLSVECHFFPLLTRIRAQDFDGD